MGLMNISVSSFLSSCDSNDIKELKRALINDGQFIGYSNENFSVDQLFEDLSITQIEEFLKICKNEELLKEYNLVNNGSVGETIFEVTLNKLHGKWNRLTNEEEDIIMKIANRF